VFLWEDLPGGDSPGVFLPQRFFYIIYKFFLHGRNFSRHYHLKAFGLTKLHPNGKKSFKFSLFLSFSRWIAPKPAFFYDICP
jgi:hypothetical protein